MAANRVLVRAAYAYDADEVSDETGLKCLEPTLTVQSTKEETDINVILDRFGITGQLPVGIRRPTFKDFGDQIFDFRSAVETIAMAEDAFMAMPARVRSRFDNDPQKFLEFTSDDKNLEEMRALGLAVPAKPAEPPAPAGGSGSGGNPQ